MCPAKRHPRLSLPPNLQDLVTVPNPNGPTRGRGQPAPAFGGQVLMPRVSRFLDAFSFEKGTSFHESVTHLVRLRTLWAVKSDEARNTQTENAPPRILG